MAASVGLGATVGVGVGVGVGATVGVGVGVGVGATTGTEIKSMNPTFIVPETFCHSSTASTWTV